MTVDLQPIADAIRDGADSMSNGIMWGLIWIAAAIFLGSALR